MISRSPKRCRHGVVRTKGPIVRVSNSTSLRVMFMAAPHRADWCQNSLTRHPCGKVRNTSHRALLTGKTTQDAWRSKPSFYAVATQDRTINPDLQRFMAKRMGATTIEVNASHLSLISHPQEITDLILQAVRR